ncbi:MAG: histidinol-phosphatase [SAR324 cluster bacterium]|nr:histidinol-phosphatase [SAR324 cluster bacterium]
MINYNLHTHTFRCKHATGDAVDFAKKAVAGGLTILGISDHTPLPDGRWSEIRMSMDQLDSYDAAVEEARAQYPELTILKGMECEWAPEFKNFYQDELLGKRGYDYLIGAGHYFKYLGTWFSSFTSLHLPKALNVYAKQLESMMATGLFNFIAHPDLFGCTFEKWDKNLQAASLDIINASLATNTPLEINANGYRRQDFSPGPSRKQPYPWEPFWEFAGSHNIKAIVGSDAHHPSELLTKLDLCETLAKKVGVKLLNPRDIIIF